MVNKVNLVDFREVIAPISALAREDLLKLNVVRAGTKLGK